MFQTKVVEKIEVFPKVAPFMR